MDGGARMRTLRRQLNTRWRQLRGGSTPPCGTRIVRITSTISARSRHLVRLGHVANGAANPRSITIWRQGVSPPAAPPDHDVGTWPDSRGDADLPWWSGAITVTRLRRRPSRRDAQRATAPERGNGQTIVAMWWTRQAWLVCTDLREHATGGTVAASPSGGTPVATSPITGPRAGEVGLAPPVGGDGG